MQAVRAIHAVSVVMLQVSLSVNAAEIRYSAEVAPILQKYCLACHHRAEPQGGLSLQSPDDIAKGSEDGPVLNADHPDMSRLLQVLIAQDRDRMPPQDELQPSDADRQTLIEWLRHGAQFDTRMAILPKLPTIPLRHKSPPDSILTLAVSAGHQSVLVGRSRSIEMRSLPDLTVSWSFPVPDGKVRRVQSSRDGKRILAATGIPGLSGRALEVSVADSAVIREFTGHDDLVYAAVWSPDEMLVATAGYDRKIILHQAATGQKVRELTGHNGAVFDLAFSPDGTLLSSASADSTVKVWSVATGERFDTLSQPLAEQHATAFSPDGESLFAVGADSRIRKWQIVSRTSPQINPLRISRYAHEGEISGLQVSADGRLLATCSASGNVKLWNAATVTEIASQNFAPDYVTCMVFESNSEKLLIGTSQGKLREFPVFALEDTIAMSAPAAADAPTNDVEALSITEQEPNSDLHKAQAVGWPVSVTGNIHSAESGSPDMDLYRFSGTAGKSMVFEVRAARDKSALDSLLEIVTVDGRPVLQAQLQAVRDSYFTFRGKDSETSDDFRLFNWQEMELNEYLYADGEVVKLWLYPRGPDSGFKVYPGFGPRQTYFGTTPSSHPLQGPAFIVTAHAPDARLRNTGLPVFQIYAENDDDPMRQWGKDSRLTFVPPKDGDYVVRIRDARGFQGQDFQYSLQIRRPAPDYRIEVNIADVAVHRGAGAELIFTATRLDGFEGPVEIFAENLPPGLVFSPMVIQQEQRQAAGILTATVECPDPTPEAISAIRLKARALIQGQEIVHELSGLKSLKITPEAKISIRIISSDARQQGLSDHCPELTIWAGETTQAFLKVDRRDHTGLVEFGKEDSGRNLPHGVYVDNIGLNGLMLLEGQNEREFFITAARWVPETSRPFFLKSNVDGNVTSLPVMIHIRHRPASAPAQ